MEQQIDERLASLKAMSAFTGVDIQVKEIVNDWILLTFDIPHSEEGDKARLRFYKEAKRIGAVPHTESVYLLPWTPEGELLALDVAKIGSVYLWVTKIKDELLAVGVMSKYDEGLKERISGLSQRVTKIQKHKEEGKDGLVQRMLNKTWPKVAELQNILVRRGSLELLEKLVPILNVLSTLK